MKLISKSQLFVSIACVAVTLGLLWMVLPYPVSLYLASRKSTQYIQGWPITETDFREAQRAVSRYLRTPFEFISSAKVESASRVTFKTTQSSNKSGSSGAMYTLEKATNGWVMMESEFWYSYR